MRILFIGDVFGECGRKVVATLLPLAQSRFHPDLIVANTENAAPTGKGIYPANLDELKRSGVHLFTSGNHIWDRTEIYESLGARSDLLRPHNFPPSTPGRGIAIVHTPSRGEPVAVINLMGRILMEPMDCPFRALDDLIASVRNQTKVILVDFHAETTSEKAAFAFYADGRVSAVLGTHTHVQTADARILPKGTAYITDVGMSGSQLSVIGVQPELAIRKFMTRMHVRFEPDSADPALAIAVVDIHSGTGKAERIEAHLLRP